MPKVIVLDEPTTGLDPILQQSIYSVIRQRVSNGATIFMSSHNLAEVEEVCDSVCVIKLGEIIATEKVSALKNKKIHTVKVYFEEKVNRSDLESADIEFVRDLNKGMELTVKGDLNKLISKLAKHRVKDIEITQANLEKIFLEYYK